MIGTKYTIWTELNFLGLDWLLTRLGIKFILRIRAILNISSTNLNLLSSGDEDSEECKK